MLDWFDGRDISEIGLKEIQQFTNARLSKIKSISVQRELSCLRAILNKMHREGCLAAVPRFPRLKKPKGRSRWLTYDEEKWLLAVAASHIKPLIAVAVDTKNGEDRSVRQTDRARKVLADLGPQENGPVFTYRGKAIASVKSAFDKAKELAGIEGLRFHDLRHTFAARLVQQGVSLYEVMHLTGHKSFSMVQRYAHLAPNFQAQAIDKLNDAGTIWAQSPEIDSAEEVQNGRNPKVSLEASMVGTAGIEPATPTMST